MGALIQMNPMQQIRAYLVYIGDEVKAVEVPPVISTGATTPPVISTGAKRS